MKHYVIIGNGVAGATAAEKIRSLDKEGGLTVFSEESQPFYYRVRLPEIVSGQAQLKQITIHPLDWYEKNHIHLRLGEAVNQVDLKSKQVIGSKGSIVPFDALLLATGARCFVPPVTGADKPGLYTLRTLADAEAIVARVGEVKEAVLIGGGLLGLEAGFGLIKRGLQVNVVEFFDRLLPRQMDRAGAGKLQRMLEHMGFTFFLNAKTQAVFGQSQAEGVTLEDGRSVPGGLVLFSAGIRPNLDLAKSMGLEVDKGVKVDDRLMTSQEGVWAAGDLTEHRGRMYGIWAAAREQGLVAGTNMAGGAGLYQGTLMSNSLKVVGVDLTSAGNIDPDDRLTAAVYEDEQVYRKIVLDQGRIAGFIFFGATKGVKEAQAAMVKGLDVSQLAPAMIDKDFDFGRL